MSRLLTFFKNVDGVSLYPILALGMFIAFFAIVTLWALYTRSTDMDRYAQLPLDPEDQTSML
ncbi:MAG: hypothetical protein RLZZ02_473 [Bacteroidota bacterium]|jgi:hypothetical protein